MFARCVTSLVMGVCAAVSVSAASGAEASDSASAFEKDRQAILAMAGPHQVSFNFQETVGIAPGYELKKPYHEEAKELVEVIEDTGTRISLQHLLIVEDDDGNDAVIKHWRQDWTYEDTDVLAFRGDRTWEHVTLTPQQAKGMWTQSVWHVDDSPRYESVGSWQHTGERSSWESGETWRPLPRREYTKRRDYQVIVARNRHTITPTGWVHEQDNRKLVIDDAGQPVTVIAHESGLNVYDRDETTDFSAGREYWAQTAAYWEDVRGIWNEVLAAQPRMKVHEDLDGKRLYKTLFKLAEDLKEQGDVDEAAQTADAQVRTYVAVVPN